jgi:hypothetical protein
MSIVKLSDAVIRRLVPKRDAAACLSPEVCDACANPVYTCYNGRWSTLRYTLHVNDCLGRCTIYSKRLCQVSPTNKPC